MNTPNIFPPLTLEDCLAQYPEISEALRQAGAKQERERIQAVEAHGRPGFEALIQLLKYDGKTTGEEATVLIFAADKQQCVEKAQRYVQHRLAPLAIAANWEEESQTRIQAATPQEQWTADYYQSTALQTEFGQLETYLAFKKAQANGQIHCIGGR